MLQNKINIKTEAGKTFIMCPIRKKWVLLTPEEKIRQFTIHFFSEQLNYPKPYISVEKQIKVNKMQKRYDIVVYDRQLKPHILVECKAQHVVIDEQTLKQLLNYNLAIQAPFLMITNGSQHFYFRIHNNQFQQIDNLPAANEIFI